MIVTIHQPEHLPWLGFFNKMSTAGCFVYLDNVQFRKNYFQNRNRINGSNGEQWIGVPVETRGHMDTPICDIRIANASNPKWKEKYLKTIEYSYCKYPYFKEYFPFFEGLLSMPQNNLCDLNISIINYFAELLELQPEYIRASQLDISGAKSDLILDICKRLNASTYVAGPSGRDYLEEAAFHDAKIEVVYNDYMHPVYEQYKMKKFIPYLSILDLFMNLGTIKSREMICSTRHWNKK